MRGRRRIPAGAGLGLAGTTLLHCMAGVLLVWGAEQRRPSPPVYRVQLVAAPEPDDAARQTPPAVPRPAPEPPPATPTNRATPAPAVVTPKPAPPVPSTARHEANPLPTTPTQPLPGEQPSTGTDVASVSTEGVDFPYPEYLQNIVTQILERWERPYGEAALDAEVSFFIHRDGSVTDLQFVKRSGDFAYDLEAEGAVEGAARFKAFGTLPRDWGSDVLFVRFYFTGRRP
jgi:periplasmic protein TonB